MINQREEKGKIIAQTRAITKVSYNTNDSTIQIQEKLDQAIQNKIEFVKGVWEERQSISEEINTIGTTNFKTDKQIVKPK